MITGFNNYKQLLLEKEQQKGDYFICLLKFVDHLKQEGIELSDVDDATVDKFLDNECNVSEGKKHKKPKCEDDDTCNDKEEKLEGEELLSPKQRKLPYGLKKAIIKKLKSSKKVNESSETDFAINYGEELKIALSKIKELSKIIPTDFYNNENIKTLEKKMSIYDKNVTEQIFSWIDSKYVLLDDIIKFAIANYNGFGTEPQFILYAIDDFYTIVKKLI
jgi:hypothetical protein